MIAITHRLTSVIDYDEIFVIVEGAMVEQGTHSELLAGAGEYARLWAEQTGTEMPGEAPFDVVDALSRVSLFRELDTESLEEVAARLRPFTIDTGGTMADGGGLVLVESGRGEVLSALDGGELTPTADLGPGDVFGLAAILGGPATSSLPRPRRCVCCSSTMTASRRSPPSIPRCPRRSVAVPPPPCRYGGPGSLGSPSARG